MDAEYSYDDGAGPVFCKARNGDCWDDLCCDYGCALMAGMLPDRDETFDLEEDAPYAVESASEKAGGRDRAD